MKYLISLVICLLCLSCGKDGAPGANGAHGAPGVTTTITTNNPTAPPEMHSFVLVLSGSFCQTRSSVTPIEGFGAILWPATGAGTARSPSLPDVTTLTAFGYTTANFKVFNNVIGCGNALTAIAYKDGAQVAVGSPISGATWESGQL